MKEFSGVTLGVLAFWRSGVLHAGAQGEVPSVLVVGTDGPHACAVDTGIDLDGNLAELRPVLPAEGCQYGPVLIDLLMEAERQGLRHRHVESDLRTVQTREEGVRAIDIQAFVKVQLDGASVGEADPP